MKRMFLLLVAFALLACSDDSIYSPKSDIVSTAVYDTPCENGKVVDYRDGRTYKCFTIPEHWIVRENGQYSGEYLLFVVGAGQRDADAAPYKVRDTIGWARTQSWMTENLNFGTFINGTEVQGNATWESAEKYCRNDQLTSCDAEGGLYQWHTAMALESKYDNSSVLVKERRRGICPGGWHIPDHGELQELFDIFYYGDAALCDSLNGVVGWAAAKEMGETDEKGKAMYWHHLSCDGGSGMFSHYPRERDQAWFVRCVKD